MATFSTSALAVASHMITTSYGGDGNFNTGTGSLTGNPQVVYKASSVTAVTSSANPSIAGQSVTFTATVPAVAPGGGLPGGTVTFLDGASSIGAGTLSGGVATFSTSALSIGSHTITTSYGGDGNFNGSTGSLTGNPQVVTKSEYEHGRNLFFESLHSGSIGDVHGDGFSGFAGYKRQVLRGGICIATEESEAHVRRAGGNDCRAVSFVLQRPHGSLEENASMIASASPVN